MRVWQKSKIFCIWWTKYQVVLASFLFSWYLQTSTGLKRAVSRVRCSTAEYDWLPAFENSCWVKRANMFVCWGRRSKSGGRRCGRFEEPRWIHTHTLDERLKKEDHDAQTWAHFADVNAMLVNSDVGWETSFPVSVAFTPATLPSKQTA